MMENKEFLVYVKPLGKNAIDYYEYDFFFSETPDVVWGDDWGEPNPSSCQDTEPYDYTYISTYRLKTTIPFSVAQENSCFPMRFAKYGLIALCYENISDYDEYPEPCRIVLHFGEEFDEVEKKLSRRQAFFSSV